MVSHVCLLTTTSWPRREMIQQADSDKVLRSALAQENEQAYLFLEGVAITF